MPGMKSGLVCCVGKTAFRRSAVSEQGMDRYMAAEIYRGNGTEKKTEYYKDLYRDLCSDRSKKREKRLQQHCKWLRLLPGVFFFCQILLLFSLLT